MWTIDEDVSGTTAAGAAPAGGAAGAAAGAGKYWGGAIITCDCCFSSGINFTKNSQLTIRKKVWN